MSVQNFVLLSLEEVDISGSRFTVLDWQHWDGNVVCCQNYIASMTKSTYPLWTALFFCSNILHSQQKGPKVTQMFLYLSRVKLNALPRPKHSLSPSLADDINSAHYMKTWHNTGSSLVQNYYAEKQITWAMSQSTGNHSIIPIHYTQVKLMKLPVKLSTHAATQWNEVNEFWLVLTLTDHAIETVWFAWLRLTSVCFWKDYHG